MWDNSDLRKFSEPAPEPNFALFETTSHTDVLVQYDAVSKQPSTIKRASYFLQPNQARITAGKKPKWVNPAVADGMQSIPVLPVAAAATDTPPEHTTYALTTHEGRGFSLYGPGASKEEFALPVYAETSGTFTRLVLTPFAVVGDTVLAGGVTAVVGVFVWLEMGAPIH